MGNWKKTIAVLVLLTFALSVLAGCTPAANPPAVSSESAGSTPAGSETTDEKPVIALSIYLLGTDSAQAQFDSVKETVEAAGCIFKYLVCDDDLVKQANQIDTFIAEGVDAIIIMAVDNQAILSSVEKCNKAGIPVLWFDREITSTATAKVEFGTGAAEVERARGVAQWMVDYAKENGKFLKIAQLVGSLTDKNAVLRDQGFTEVFEANPDVCEIVTKINTDWDTEKGLSGTINAFQAYPEINCVVSPADHLLVPIVSALQQMGKWHKADHPDYILVNGFDGDVVSLQGMLDGYVLVMDAYPIWQCGVKVAEVAVDLARGGTAPAAEEGILPGMLITAENYNELAPLSYTYLGGTMSELMK